MAKIYIKASNLDVAQKVNSRLLWWENMPGLSTTVYVSALEFEVWLPADHGVDPHRVVDQMVKDSVFDPSEVEWEIR